MDPNGRDRHGVKDGYVRSFLGQLRNATVGVGNEFRRSVVKTERQQPV